MRVKVSFFDKLERQLAPAPASAKQLAAEMLWVMYLALIRRAMHPGTRRQADSACRLGMVGRASFLRRPLSWKKLSTRVSSILELAYNTHRWREFEFLVRDHGGMEGSCRA